MLKQISIEALKKGDDTLFKKLYEDHREQFINFARRYDLERDDIIDVYQDAYIIFYNNVLSGTLTTLTSSVSTYLFSIGKHLIYNKLKKVPKTVRLTEQIHLNYDSSNLEDISFTQDTLTTEQQLLRKHFAALGAQCKTLLSLFYYRGFTIKEIVESTAYTNENVVKSAKSRCMKTLKARINSK
jgi:RNA polymerase sigma-70 factor (ECF subfamily)